MARITIYRWAKDRGIIPQVAYSWRRLGLPVDSDGRIDPEKADVWLRSRGEERRHRRTRRAVPVPDRHALVSELAAREEESVVKGLCSLGFLRAQGRTLAAHSQRVFCDIVWNEVYGSLSGTGNCAEFDRLHEGWVALFQRSLTTARGGQLSYGQGQKSLNVVLKFVVDWASRPDSSTADRLRPWLHCPLDRVVMQYLHDLYPEDYRLRIRPFYPRVYGPQRFLLANMNDEAYHAWQVWIRDLYPSKPVLLDVVWVFERPGSVSAQRAGTA
jgi:hypothetical protein